MRKKSPRPAFVVCVKNDKYPASLELRKIYKALTDTSAATKRLVRVIDESGEDYLYPQSYFIPIELPRGAKSLFARSS